MHYNPFAYIHSEKDILKLVNTLICNTKGDGKSGDDFWVKAETLLYCALIGYIHYEAPEEEQNFATLIELVNAMEVREDDETFENPVDIAFKELEKDKPNHFAVRQYKKYKLAAGKTAKSINISCGARLAPFDIAELREITMYDELELDTLGDKIYDNPDAKDGRFKKTSLFLIMSDTDSTFNFLISMIYSQLFNLLCEKADDQYKGRLPVHVRCLIDEAANIGQIPNLEKLMATIRSREISACLVLQAQSQLKALYKDNADTIIGNCDTSIFLGGKEPTTLKELNQALGKETIDTFNTGESRGREVSHSLNYTDANMLPLTKERALELMERDVTVYMLHTDNTEAMAFDADEIRSFDGIFGVEASEWETVKDRFAPQDYEKAFLDNPGDSFAIYQLRDSDDTARLHFMNYEYASRSLNFSLCRLRYFSQLWSRSTSISLISSASIPVSMSSQSGNT